MTDMRDRLDSVIHVSRPGRGLTGLIDRAGTNVMSGMAMKGIFSVKVTVGVLSSCYHHSTLGSLGVAPELGQLPRCHINRLRGDKHP
jgi:hypothetical protein